MEDNPIQNDARNAKRLRKFRENAACALCGITNPEVLLLANRSLIDMHHVAGRNNDPDFRVPLCRNCHAIATARLRHSGVSMKEPRTLLQRLLAILKGIASFLAQAAERLFSLAEECLDSISRGRCPLCGNETSPN